VENAFGMLVNLKCLSDIFTNESVTVFKFGTFFSFEEVKFWLTYN
jgi:hypothetical protein